MFLGFCSAGGVFVLALIDDQATQILLFIKCAFIGFMIASWNGLFLAEVSNVAQEDDISEATAASTFFTFISYMIAPPIFGLIADPF